MPDNLDGVREPNSPVSSPCDSHDDTDEARQESPAADKDAGQQRSNKHHAGVLTPTATSSFETDLSSPLRNRNEDRSGVYKSDPKYQKYVQLVERNLQSFDYVSEWADVTAFLTKLSRAFEIYQKFAIVPHKETVAKRLAQCLNPALPTGVHQKALSLYAQIFKQIGPQQLVVDLPLYAYGLFPFMRNASLKAKPQLLELFEQFFLPLGASLRACMKSFTMGLLPGLEEGSKDVFDRVMKLLDRLRDTVDPAFFFPTMFLIMITNTEQRESALKYLAQRLPVFSQQEDLDQIAGEDSSLMVRALAATLSDSKTLVLRAALDLVMTRLPLRTNVLADKDLALLMKHASEVVLKKDMSLNRRLYTWLLGQGETEAEQAAYFAEHSQAALTTALLGSFAALSASPDQQHTVLRVLIGLIDRPDISQPILDTIFIPLLRLLISERDSVAERALPARLASVSRMFMEMLDPIFVWSQIISQLVKPVVGSSGPLDIEVMTRALHLLLFFVQTFDLDDDATLHVHLPMALLAVLATLQRVLDLDQVKASPQTACYFTRITIDIFTRIPKAAFSASDDDSAETVSVDQLFDTTRLFYRIRNPEDPEEIDTAQIDKSAAEVVRGSGLLVSIVRLCKSIVAQLGRQIIAEPADSSPFLAMALEDVCHVLRTAATYSHSLLNDSSLAKCEVPLPQQLVSSESHPDAWVLVLIAAFTKSSQFRTMDVALSTLLDFANHKSLPVSVLADPPTLHQFVAKLWNTLEPSNMPNHFRASQLLYQLRKQVDAREVERQLARRLSADSLEGSEYSDELSRYSVFWYNLRMIQREADDYDPLTFARLLLLVLDNVSAMGDSVSDLQRHMAAKAWVDASALEWEHILESLVYLLLLSVRTHKRRYQTTLSIGNTSMRQEYMREFDYGRINYYIDTIQRYLACGGDGVIRSMLTAVPKNPKVAAECETFVDKSTTWMQLLCAAVAEFALTDAPVSGVSTNTRHAVEVTRTKAARLVVYLVSRPLAIWPSQFIANLQSRVIDTLLFCVLHRRPSTQPPLLDLLVSLIQASVTTKSEQTAVASATVTTSPQRAGIGGVSDTPLFARLILAALTLQLDVAALRKWVSVITMCLPYIQEQISAVSPAHRSDNDLDLMTTLVVPCMQSLRLLLSQCAEYFARSNGLQHEQHLSVKHQLSKHILPLFAIPAASESPVKDSDEDHAKPMMNIDVLVALLDAFELFLTLALKNADRVPVSTTAMLPPRPSSRASVSSIESTGSAISSIPILKFVSSIFSLDDEADDSVPEATPESSATNTNSNSESDGFCLVSILAVIRQVWDAFDFNQPRKPSVVSDRQVLGDFGLQDTAAVRSGSIHMQQAVHSRITRILESAVAAQQAEVTEAMAALWIRDNPSWITNLAVSTRNSTSPRSRRRHSSVSSFQSPLSPTSSTHREIETASVADIKSDAAWVWRTTDLFESVPGRTPTAILLTLLNSLHIRCVDLNPASTGSVSSPLSTTSGSVANDRPHMRFSSMEDVALARFIELYTRHRVTARTSSPLIPHVNSMLREYNNNAQQFKLVLPFVLRMFTELCERIASNSQAREPSASSQKTYSRELFDLYAKMVDNCILISGRSFDQTTWLRRTNADINSQAELVVRTDASSNPTDDVRVVSETDVIEQILTYISQSVIPQFSLLVPDYELQVSIAINLMHYAVTPALKSHMTGGFSGPAQTLTSRSKHFSLIIDCLTALSHQASLMKVWRREVWDFFCDGKFFPSSASTDLVTMAPDLMPWWRHLVKTLLASEKDKFAEILAKVTATSSGPALFANREHEALLRSVAVRRLSFVVWAGTVNQYLPSLPQIQEKLVDILKNNPHPAVQIEVFLCLRVLLCRVSSHHMSNFWPMLLTELMRLCLQQLRREGSEEADQANLFLSACKFLDLLFILGTDDFLVHQWIFITDTIDALYGSRSASYALLDQLSTRLLSMPSRHGIRHVSVGLDNGTYPAMLITDSDDPTNLVYRQTSKPGEEIATKLGVSDGDLQALGTRPLKRPIIRVRSVASIRELDAFVHNASVQAYQTAYTMAEPDMQFIEALLVSDLMYFDFGSTSSGAAQQMQMQQMQSGIGMQHPSSEFSS